LALCRIKDRNQLTIGIIDKESALGKKYELMKAENKFYNSAKFYSTKEIIALLEAANFSQIKVCQTIFSNPEEMAVEDPVKDGFGEGAFVVLSAIKYE
jgi:CTP-dependent riboflavin kinase